MTIDELWKQLPKYEGHIFYTSKGLDFTYKIRGNEIFFSRKEKSVTRASVEIGLKKALEVEGKVSGPKKLGTFGASYLYPVFQELGIVRKEQE